MYNRNINHRELRYFHGKVKSTLITELDNSDYIFSDGGRYYPLFCFENVNTDDELKNIRNKCLIGDNQYVHFESD